MSKTAVNDFLKKLDADAELRGSLKAALEGKADEVPTIMSFASREGMEFTREEYCEVVEEISAQEGELHDSDLEKVAGGRAASSSSRLKNVSVRSSSLASRLNQSPRAM